MTRQRIAVVGGGIAGLAAAHRLRARHDVTLFERRTRLGGNAYTFTSSRGDVVEVGVAAFGRAGYPRFYRLAAEVGVHPEVSPGAFLSIHDLDRRRGLYLTPDLAGLRAQRLDILRPGNLLALLRLGLGLHRGVARHRAGRLAGQSVADALAGLPELRGPARRVLLAVLCLLSSMSADEILAAPADFFFGKLAANPDVLSPRAFASVRCVRGGTRRTVDAIARGLADVRRGTAVTGVHRDGAGVALDLADGATAGFDQVVLACNADEALALLDAPSAEERRLLGPWAYKEGRVVVHRDHAAFPPRPLIQAYTFLYTERGGRFATSVSGCLWRLPGVPASCDLLSTQHPNFPIRPELVELDTVLRTPIFDRAAVATIPELPSLNGRQRTWYCGSHFGHGLHEDAVRSGEQAAEGIGQ